MKIPADFHDQACRTFDPYYRNRQRPTPKDALFFQCDISASTAHAWRVIINDIETWLPKSKTLLLPQQDIIAVPRWLAAKKNL